MKALQSLLTGLLILQLGFPWLWAQPVLIQPNSPLQQQSGTGVYNLRIVNQTKDGTLAILAVDFSFDGAGQSAMLLPVIEKKDQKGVSAWFGADPVTVNAGRGMVAVKVKYFNDEPGVPPQLTTDRVKVLILNDRGTVVLSTIPFLKTIKWGTPDAKPAQAVTPPPAGGSQTQAAAEAERQKQKEAQAREQARIKAEAEAKRLAEEKAKADEKAKKLADERQRREQEAKAREEARLRAETEAKEREEAKRKADAEIKRLAEEKRQAEEKARAEAKVRAEAKRQAEAEEKRLAEERRLAEKKAKEEAEQKEKDRQAEIAKQREAERKQAEAEAKRLAEEQRVAEAKAKAEAEAREKARLAAEAQAKQLAEEKAKAEEKARIEAATREAARKQADAEAKALAEAETKAKAEAEQQEKARLAAEAQVKKLAEEKRKIEEEAKADVKPVVPAPAPLATIPVPTPAPSPSATLRPLAPAVAANLKTKVTNVDVVNRSLDRSQMTIGVEFEYKDGLSKPMMGVEVSRAGEPEASRYFETQPAELGRSHRNFLLFPVKFTPASGMPATTYQTDKVLVYLKEAADAQRLSLFPATMLLMWRPPGATATAGSPARPAMPPGSWVEMDDFKQTDASTGYVTIKYNLATGTGRLRARLSDSTRAGSATWFEVKEEKVNAGRGLQLLDLNVKPDAASTGDSFQIDTVELELIDPGGKVVATQRKSLSASWSRPKQVKE